MSDKHGRILGQLVAPVAGQNTDSDVTPGMAKELFWQSISIEKASADAMAADTTNRSFWRAPFPCLVRSAYYIPDASLTANDTNYATVSLQKGTAGALVVAATMLTTTTGTGDWVADTPEQLTLSSTIANRELAEGDLLNFDIAKAASGVAVPAGVLVVCLEPVDE